MNRSHIICGVIIGLIVLMITPIGSSATSIDETLFLDPGHIPVIRTLQVSNGDVVRWSFLTRDDPFKVNMISTGAGVMVSSGKTSDSGSVEAIATGTIAFTFFNMDSVSGYIELKIYIQAESIGGFYPILIVMTLLPLTLILLIRKRKSVN